MSETFSQWLDYLVRIFTYPLFELGKTQVDLAVLLKLLLLLMIVVVGERVLRKYLLLRFLKRTRLDSSLQFGLSRLAGYIILALGIFVALQLVGIDLSSLAFMAGAIGVGLGFGLKNVVANFVSGILILAERPITIGDRIEVANVTGQVTKIRLRSTTVVTNDNISVIVPNSYFMENSIINWSYGDPKVRLRLPVGVAYGTDIDKLGRILLEVAQENAQVLKEPQPRVFFGGYGDSALNFELAVWTRDMAAAPRGFKSDLYFAIERKLRANDIEIPFPQRDLHLRSGHFILKNEDPGNGERNRG